MKALIRSLVMRFGLRLQRWPMATFPRNPKPELRFRRVKRDGYIYIEPVRAR